MTTRRRISPPLLPFSTRKSRRSIHDEHLDDDLSSIPDNYNDRRNDNAESHDEPLWRPSRNAMGKRPSKDSITSTLRKRVAAIQLTSTTAEPQHPESQEVYIVSEEEDEREPAPLASKKVSD